MGSKIHIIGGGTFSHVRNHLAIAAPAFGGTARSLYKKFHNEVATFYYEKAEFTDRDASVKAGEEVQMHLTKMASPKLSNLVTNEDVAALLETLKADPETRVIIMSAALCDYDGNIIEHHGGAGWNSDPYLSPSGSHADRLKSRDGDVDMRLTPAAKLIGEIRKDRKDIFVVGFKTTTGETSDDQYKIALNMLKRDSLNLVLANDTVTRNNMIVTPEEARYHETTDRDEVLRGLVQIVMARSMNTFTRSTVVEGDPVAWTSPMIPDNLREVVDHCIKRGAYKPFRGATVGHFAVKVDEGTILTSKRKRDFNKLSEEGLVKVEYGEGDNVIAFGAKPSVGGQSQRIIFTEHKDADCIVHFHCPVREDARDVIPVAPQWQNECGSHQCGENTSRNLGLTDDRLLKVVMLENHGPNIVFNRATPAKKIIEFIEANFDLDRKTGGLVA